MEQEKRLYFPAQSANKEITILLKTNRSIQIDWSFKSIADSAKSILCTEKQSNVG